MSMKKDPAVKKILAENLKQLMKIDGTKYKDLAVKLNLSKGAVSNYIHARSMPNADRLKQIAEVFNVSVDALISPAKKIVPVLKEDPYKKDAEHVIPVFTNRLCSVEDLFAPDNFNDYIESTFPTYGDYKCYAVRIHNNNLISSGITDRSRVIFALDTEIKKNQLAAVLIKNEKKIMICRIVIKNDTITLSTDKTKKTYPYSKTDGNVRVLGRAVEFSSYLN